jgi:hypothetical protein
VLIRFSYSTNSIADAQTDPGRKNYDQSVITKQPQATCQYHKPPQPRELYPLLSSVQLRGLAFFNVITVKGEMIDTV